MCSSDSARTPYACRTRSTALASVLPIESVKGVAPSVGSSRIKREKTCANIPERIAQWEFNARLHADLNDSFSVELYGTNLTNDLSWTTAGGTTSIFGLPHRKTFAPLPRKREVGLKVTAGF